MTLQKQGIRGSSAPYTGAFCLLLLASFIASHAQENSSSSFEPAFKSKPVLQPRQFAAVAHDTLHRQFLLFGGTYGAFRFNDTWLLDESGWKEETPKVSPSARISSSAVYDSLRNQFVLFGGRVKHTKTALCSPGEIPPRLETDFFCGDTWVFADGRWVKKNTESAPSAREGHAMAFDAARKQIVLFGGTTGSSSTPLNDTWIWDGKDWDQVHPAHRPPARLWHSMAYDPVHRLVILFGGDSGSHFLDDTWLWDGKDWHAAHLQTARPPFRTNGAIDYDATTRRMVLFSGCVWDRHRTGAIALDSWSWDGSQWKKLPASKFHLVKDFSRLRKETLDDAILANGTPSFLWIPENGP